MNVGLWIEKWASLQPKKCAVIFEGQTFTYENLNVRVKKLSNFFLGKGIKKGDRVAVLLYNSNQYVETFFALSYIGAILVPLNFRLSGAEIEFILKDSKPEILIFGEEFIDILPSIRSHIPIKETSYVCVGKTIPPWAKDYEKEIEQGSLEETLIGGLVGGEDPHIIMYTSGTTGLPKGAILSHRKTFFNILNADIYYGLDCNDIFLITRALFHSGGLLVTTSPMLYKGGTIILKKRLRPKEILETIENYKVTVLEAPATMYKFILDQCDLEKYDLSSVRCWFTGGERVPPSLLTEYQKRGIVISQIYGQTETSTITWLPRWEASRKSGSVGIPVFHGNAKIVDKEGKEVNRGEVGEIVVSGPILMTGYWENPQMTEETVRQGWLHTGDLARRDEEGYFYIVDREKDMFISGGENVYPAEIEKLYLDNPKILDVAIVGIVDEKWGEVGKAFIVLKEGERMTEEEAINFCEGKVARYKIPKSISFVKELPKTAAEKIMRYKLREGYVKQKDGKDS